MQEITEGFERLQVTCRVDDLETTGFVERRDLSTHERLMRALRILAILWLVAGITVFVPILHFVLVPGFFLLGILFSVTTWMGKGEIAKGAITCPNCKKAMEIGKEAEGWPRVQRCTGCAFTLTVKPLTHKQL